MGALSRTRRTGLGSFVDCALDATGEGAGDVGRGAMPQQRPDEHVHLSVQGAVFVLGRRFMESQPWILAKMFTSGIPFKTVGDMTYLDADPTAFRFVVAILRGFTTVEDSLARISTIDAELIRTTASYLMCSDLVDDIDYVGASFQRQLRAKDEQIRRLEAVRVMAQARDDQMLHSLGQIDIQQASCRCRRQLMVLSSGMTGAAGLRLDCQMCTASPLQINRISSVEQLGKMLDALTYGGLGQTARAHRFSYCRPPPTPPV